MIGESPIRPLIFQLNPLVVVMPETSPFESTARTLVVP